MKVLYRKVLFTLCVYFYYVIKTTNQISMCITINGDFLCIMWNILFFLTLMLFYPLQFAICVYHLDFSGINFTDLQ